MDLGIVAAILLSLFIALLMTENYGYGYWMISRPVFAGPLLGLLMGDLQTGLIVGASVELMFMGVLPIGGSVPPNAQIAGLIGTVFAIASGGKPEVGIALALPIGILAQFLIMLAWNFNIILVHKADKYLEQGNVKRVERTHFMGLIAFFIVMFIPSFLAIYFGSEWVNNLVEAMPTWFMDGLKVTAGILPAIGMAMLLKMMNFKKYWSFFLIGFVLAIYLKLNVLSIALLGLGIAASIHAITKTRESENVGNSLPTQQQDERILTQKDLFKAFLRSFFSMTSINYERYCNLGFCYSLLPALKKLYPNSQDFKEAIVRHNEFFNCHPYTTNAIIGVSLALEEQRAQGKPITAETISSTKAALMGPLSGIGDSVFKATFMTIFAAIGAGLSLDGNPIGPIIFIVPNILLNLFSRYYGVFYGYKFGVSLILKMKDSDVLNKFVQGATIVGLMVTGAMVVNFVKISLVAKWSSGGKEIVLQELLDSILPGLLPVLLTLGFLWALLKNKQAIYWLLGLCFVLGLVGKLLNIF
ncbi:PTS system mannose/fructose/sorbose family transporter subunit IID [Heyndrickxia sporothermodurans]|uniref:PTS system mannose/fructose/sorbose family transporter subunit IID n=1 Tax=Heyndrickxia sporothermodurans TaxID=46224 RepID=UPI002DBF84A6|nr:PTS system mannose/fructose/sorbose family transporter subunit IID [Heyndrickxia sporothermodurans]MEB6551353.1 PTS system mannose/fructose/sorbose family transporter subunit IID [Heyndrickxia sporothermodurans]